jgi:hypothetical protein
VRDDVPASFIRVLRRHIPAYGTGERENELTAFGRTPLGHTACNALFMGKAVISSHLLLARHTTILKPVAKTSGN